MKQKNKLVFLFFFYLFFLSSSDIYSQRRLKIITDLDHSFERYIITIYDTNYVMLSKYTIYTPDTTILYTLPDINLTKQVDVMLSGASGIKTYFHVSKHVKLSTDSLCTVYRLAQISKKEIKDSKNRMEHPSSLSITKKEHGIFNKGSPWMYCMGYTYQQSHIVNLEVRKTGVDISGNHGDGQYGLTLLYAPYLILGGDAIVSPNFQFAPKVGVGVYAFIVNANISCIGYNTNFNKFNPAIVPEVGLSAPFGFLHIDYGYNFYLNEPVIFNNKNHRISLKFSWYFNSKKIW